MADAGFDQQAAHAFGRFLGHGAGGGVGAGRGRAYNDESGAFHGRQAGQDQRGVARVGAFPGRNADAIDAVPAGRPAFGSEVALGIGERVGGGTCEGLVGHVPARAALEIEPEVSQGVGQRTGDVEFKGDGRGEVEVDGLVPGEAVAAAGKGRGEGHAAGGLGRGRGFQVGLPGGSGAGREILHQARRRGGRRRGEQGGQQDFPQYGKCSGGFSTVWKKSARFFHGVENFFPRCGKLRHSRAGCGG